MGRTLKRIALKGISIIFISLLITVPLIFLLSIGKSEYVTTSFSIQFDGIERGISPDNARLEYDEIVSQTVLMEVFENAGIIYKDIYAENFEVQPVLPAGIEKTLEKKRNKGEDYTYFPNEFMIKIKVDSSMGLDKVSCEKVAEVYKDTYENYFKRKYSYPNKPLSELIANLNYELYDYPEYTEIFSDQLKLIYSYLELLYQDDPEYKSALGHSFLDIKEAVNRLENYDLNKIDALISKYQISKNDAKLKNKYNYMLRRYRAEKASKAKEYTISNELINIVENNKTETTEAEADRETNAGENNQLTLENKQKLEQTASEAVTLTNNLDNELLKIERELAKINNPSPENQAGQNVVKTEVDQLAADLQAEINAQAEMVRSLKEEYFNYKYNNVITLVKAKSVEMKLSKRDMVLIFIVVLLLVTTVLSNITIKKNKKEKKKQPKPNN